MCGETINDISTITKITLVFFFYLNRNELFIFIFRYRIKLSHICGSNPFYRMTFCPQNWHYLYMDYSYLLRVSQFPIHFYLYWHLYWKFPIWIFFFRFSFFFRQRRKFDVNSYNMCYKNYKISFTKSSNIKWTEM